MFAPSGENLTALAQPRFSGGYGQLPSSADPVVRGVKLTGQRAHMPRHPLAAEEIKALEDWPDAKTAARTKHH